MRFNVILIFILLFFINDTVKQVGMDGDDDANSFVLFSHFFSKFGHYTPCSRGATDV